MVAFRSLIAFAMASTLVAAATPAPKLEYHFTLRLYTSREDTTADGVEKNGPQRLVFPITSGFFKGENVEADVLPGGADYNLFDQTASPAVSFPDVRTHARTSDGSGIFIQYTGIAVVDDAIQKVISFAPDAKTTNFGDHEFWVSPKFTTSIQSLSWIQTASWVGQGRWVVDDKGTAVEYGIYRIVNYNGGNGTQTNVTSTGTPTPSAATTLPVQSSSAARSDRLRLRNGLSFGFF